MKITQLGKVRLIKVNELKSTQTELIQFFKFICVTAIVFELFCIAYLANIECFLYYSNLSF